MNKAESYHCHNRLFTPAIANGDPSYGNPFPHVLLETSSWSRPSQVWGRHILCGGIAVIQVSYTDRYSSSTHSTARTLRQLLVQVIITATPVSCICALNKCNAFKIRRHVNGSTRDRTSPSIHQLLLTHEEVTGVLYHSARITHP